MLYQQLQLSVTNNSSACVPQPQFAVKLAGPQNVKESRSYAINYAPAAGKGGVVAMVIDCSFASCRIVAGHEWPASDASGMHIEAPTTSASRDNWTMTVGRDSWTVTVGP